MRSNKNGKMTTIFVILFFVFLGVAVWMENADVQDYNPDVLFTGCKVQCKKKYAIMFFLVLVM